jgi:hypothetical protein
VFESSNAAGDTARVVVKSKHGGQSVSARAGTLAQVSGPGSWSGDLFGTGAATTVNFVIGAAADGSPDITGVTSSDSTAVIGATEIDGRWRRRRVLAPVGSLGEVPPTQLRSVAQP